MKSTLAYALAGALLVLAACTSTTKGEGPGSSTSSSSGSPPPSSSSSGGSSSGTSGTSTSSSGGVSNSQCQSVCISKVYECNPDAVDVPTACRDLCGSVSYTSQQLECFQNTSCFELENAGDKTLAELCPP